MEKIAERRMIAKSIVDSDAFLTMPQSTQLLYFHLSIRADDDGFINNPRMIIRMVGANDEDIKLLILKKFVIAFEDGIIVIKHWRIHNYIRKDTYRETKFKENKKLLSTDENGEYFLCNETETNPLQTRNEPVTKPSQTVDTGKDRVGEDRLLNTDENGEYSLCNEPETKSSRTVDTGEDRIGKDRIGKDRIGEDRIGEERGEGEKEAQPTRSPYGIYRNIFLTEKELSDLIAEFKDPAFIEQEIDNMSEYLQRKANEGTPITYLSYYTKLRKWASEDKAKQKKEASHYYTPAPSRDKKPGFNNYSQRTYSDAEIDEIEKRMLERSN